VREFLEVPLFSNQQTRGIVVSKFLRSSLESKNYLEILEESQEFLGKVKQMSVPKLKKRFVSINPSWYALLQCSVFGLRMVHAMEDVEIRPNAKMTNAIL